MIKMYTLTSSLKNTHKNKFNLTLSNYKKVRDFFFIVNKNKQLIYMFN